MGLFDRITKFAIPADESIAKTNEAKTKNRMELRLTAGFLLSKKEPQVLSLRAWGSRNPPGKRISRANPKGSGAGRSNSGFEPGVGNATLLINIYFSPGCGASGSRMAKQRAIFPLKKRYWTREIKKSA